jgi:hypothetical protein
MMVKRIKMKKSPLYTLYSFESMLMKQYD